MSLSRFVVGMLSVGLMVPGWNLVFGQDYPSRPIRIVTLSPGGGSDFIARTIGEKVSGALGQPVVVDNRPSGLIATDAVAKAQPDGYTLIVNGDALWVLPLLQKTPYDAVRDLAPISLLLRELNVVAVHPSVPARSIKELIAVAKARPGELNDASGSPGGMSHLGMELFKSMTGTNIVKVPYKSTSTRLAALVSGEMQVGIFNARQLVPHVQAGKLKVLAITSSTPSVLLPDFPTMAASGLPGFESSDNTGIWATARTPEAIIRRLHQEMVRALNLPDVKEKFLNAGAETIGSTPEEFAAKIKSDIVRWGKVVKDAGIKLD